MRRALLVLALLWAGSAVAGPAKEALGFRLLVLHQHHVRWPDEVTGSPPVVTYAFATQPVSTPEARNCRSLTSPDAALERSGISRADFRREVAAAFRMWEQVANVSFRETAHAEAAGIVIGAQTEPLGRAFTDVQLESTANGGAKEIRRALICLNPDMPWKIGFDGNLSIYDVRHTIAHEVGHAIGLDHPGPTGQVMGFRYDEKVAGLQVGDIAGAVALYGPRRKWPFALAASATSAASSAAEPVGAPGAPFGIGEVEPVEALER